MDIMDSTDTPTGGLDQTTASSTYSSSALPLSVDQRDDFASPTNRSTYGGQQPTSTSDSFSFSSGGSAFDRLDAAAKIDADAANAMPTSTDDMPMPRIDFASHPSLTAGPSGSVTTSSSSTTPLSQQARDKAADARDKAADMTDSAKAKAADMADSAKAKAADMKSGAKAKAADLQDKMEDTADSIKDKLEEGAEKVKEGGHRLLEMAKSGLHSAESSLHSAEKSVEDKYEHTKEEWTSGREPHRPVAPIVRSTTRPEATDTHPAAASMRDSHLHPGLSSLPSHGNEITPIKNPQMTDVHHNALMAGEAAHTRALANKDRAESEDPLQKGGFLHRMHDKLEDGAEAVKERVDGFLERNVRRDNDEHLSAVDRKDLPTLIDSSNTHNVSQVRAKMHPSQERTMNGVEQDD